MVAGFNGWFVIVLYLLFLAVLVVVLYFLIRTAVLHALKAHTRWAEGGKS